MKAKFSNQTQITSSINSLHEVILKNKRNKLHTYIFSVVTKT